MLEDVAMVDEVADIGSPEVEPELDTGIWPRARPEGDIHGVEHLPVMRGDGLAISVEEQEMNLVDMELMILQSAILDDPIFNGTLSGHNRRRIIGAEQDRRSAFHGNKELRVGVVLGEIQQTLLRYPLVHQRLEAL